MKPFVKNAAVLLFLLIGTLLHAQKATIAGKVIDKATGEPLIGASVAAFKDGSMAGGTSTDLDGAFSFQVEANTYSIEISYTGYVKVVIKDYMVKPGSANTLDGALEEESLQLQEVVITASQVKNTDAALISIQKKAFGIQDGVSSSQISRTGSSNAADAMKQMTGAVVEGGRFIVMRGLGDRYSISQLNGITLPSTDPYRNSASLDLIPSQMIDNILTVKTFTPDLPGNFSGGLVNVNTKTFPEKFNLHFSVGAEYNTQSSLINNFLTQTKGKTDWLGFDDGSRDQPAYLLDPQNRSYLSSSTYLQARNPNPANDQIRDIFNRSSKDLSNEFVPSQQQAPVNNSFSFSVGNKLKLFGNDLGFTLGMNYSSNFAHYNDGVIGTYIYTNPTQLFDYQLLNETKSTQNPQLGGMFNLAYSLGKNHTIGGNVIFNNDAELVGRQQNGRFLGQLSDPSSVFNTNVLEFTQRQFTSYQLTGKHVFPGLNKMEIEWAAAQTQSFQKEPDLRYFAYTRTDRDGEDPEFGINNAEFAFPYHFFRQLNDQSNFGKLDISIPVLTKGKAGSSNKIKLGGLYSNTDRNFEEYRYQLNNTGVPSNLNFTAFNGDLNAFWDPANFGIIGTTYNTNGTVQRYQTGYHYINQINNRNFYTGEEEIAAGYLMGVFNLTRKLKTILGVRVESTNLQVQSRDESVAKSDVQITDALYSANLIYSFNDKNNLRLAASQTLARPNMRELAPFEQFDTKNGFFNIGNPALTRTLIQNYDLRYEIYPQSGELIAVSAFYKQFQDPIIRAFNPRATIPELSFINIDQATVYGAEVEVRKGLAFLGNAMRHFYLSANVALIHSEYNIPTDEYNNSKAINPEYDTRTRPFQGQAPYIVNLILSYLNQTKGWESSLAFNVSGEKLYNIALFATPDVYEQPFPLLQYKISKRFGQHYQASFTARNILNPMNKRTQEFKGQTYMAEAFRLGTGLGLSLAYFIR